MSEGFYEQFKKKSQNYLHVLKKKIDTSRIV